MYIAVAEHKINFCNSIQINISCFHFTIVTLKTFLLETIAKTRPSSIDNLVIKSILQAVVYISLLLQTFPLNISHFLFKHNTETILYIWYCFVYNLHSYICFLKYRKLETIGLFLGRRIKY